MPRILDYCLERMEGEVILLLFWVWMNWLEFWRWCRFSCDDCEASVLCTEPSVSLNCGCLLLLVSGTWPKSKVLFEYYFSSGITAVFCDWDMSLSVACTSTYFIFITPGLILFMY